MTQIVLTTGSLLGTASLDIALLCQQLATQKLMLYYAPCHPTVRRKARFL